MGTRPRTRWKLAAGVIVVWGLLSAPVLAATWTIGLNSGSSGEAKASSTPAAPTGVSSACVSSSQQKVKVTWSAVAHATTYTVYDSKTSSSSGYSVIASGVTTTSWTSGTLSTGSYWFEVVAIVGTNWASANSAATAQRTIGSSSCS
jgi:hypothetical protein